MNSMQAANAFEIGEIANGAQVDMARAAATCDAFLVAQAKSGCAISFGDLYERHRLKIYRTTFRILRNQQDAEDSVQRAFQRAFSNLHRFREDSAFATWVTRIAINEALMLLRQRRTVAPLPPDGFGNPHVQSVPEIADEGPTPEQTFADCELRAAVTHAISKLRESLRVVVLLRELQGLSISETAVRLGLSVAAVKARTFHARRHLRRHLQRKHKVLLAGFLVGAKH
jgi:RNA polymerase sigma-70 factor, ECF subfamily